MAYDRFRVTRHCVCGAMVERGRLSTMVDQKKGANHRMCLSKSRGFSVIEVLVIVSITALLAGLTWRTYPTIRAQQQLARAEQQLQSMLRRAAQEAVNEARQDTCLDEMKSTGQPEKLCSDMGLHLEADQMILFADTGAPDDNRYEAGNDFLLTKEQLSAPDIIETPTTFVFEAIPPILQLFVDGHAYTTPVPITLKAGDTEQDYVVHAYGQLIAQ